MVTCAKEELAKLFDLNSKKEVAQKEGQEDGSFQNLQLLMTRCRNTEEMFKLMQSDADLARKISGTTDAVQEQLIEEPSEKETDRDGGKETWCCHYHDLLSVNQFVD